MTAGALVFRSGYATYARIESVPRAYLTHSPWVVTRSSRVRSGARWASHAPPAPTETARPATAA